MLCAALGVSAGGPSAGDDPPPAASPTGSTNGAHEEPAPDRERLQALQDQIETLRKRLVEAEEKAGTIVDDLDEVALRQALLAREAELLEHDVAAARQAVAEARREAEGAQRRVALAEDELRGWLLELYKTGPAPDLDLVLSAGSASELADAARAAETSALLESRRVALLRSEQEKLLAAQDETQQRESRLKALAQELDKRSADLRDLESQKHSILDGIRAREGAEEEVLAGLVRMERDLKALLEKVVEPGAVPSHGLPRFKGLLGWPVEGKVAIPFGNVRHPKFHTEVPHPGLEIACPPGSEVRALFDGRVVFSDWLRGYGEMIVIDHGDAYLSVYGQLGERLARTGQEVGRNEAIARSGQEGTFGITGLYLEIRHLGQPQDPVPWLKKSTRH
jgi:septal ring factor EnvC (AmiA/AmiB activator)